MDDHVHVLLQTLTGFDLSKILQLLKSYTARKINELRGEQGSLWQKDSYTEILIEPIAVDHLREYIYNNPIRRWGRAGENYPWCEQFE
jgi:REP element-mobilizing transposase RayT